MNLEEESRMKRFWNSYRREIVAGAGLAGVVTMISIFLMIRRKRSLRTKEELEKLRDSVQGVTPVPHQVVDLGEQVAQITGPDGVEVARDLAQTAPDSSVGELMGAVAGVASTYLSSKDRK